MGKAPGTAYSPYVHSNVSGLVLEDTDLGKTIDMGSSPSVAGTFNTVQAEAMCTPWELKGKWEIQNLKCSINYDAMGASNRRGGKANFKLFSFEGFGVFFGALLFRGVWV